MAVPLASVLFPVLVKGNLPQILCQSRLSANNIGDNEMNPRAVDRSPGIYLMVEENPRLGKHLKAVRTVIASNGVPYLQMRSIG